MLVLEHWTVTVLETVVYIYGILCYTDYIMKKKNGNIHVLVTSIKRLKTAWSKMNDNTFYSYNFVNTL